MIVKTCPSCQTEYTYATWVDLKLLGYCDDLELRNCSCHDTLAIISKVCPDCDGPDVSNDHCDSCRGTGRLNPLQRVERRRALAFRRWKLLAKAGMDRAAFAWLLVNGWDRKHNEMVRGMG